ncbi:MAG: hypothetical protein Q8K37_05695 [Alphaproteobacteria bacterium]|nr:hypothetical protein [Alphaproteobacteria bacterium]
MKKLTLLILLAFCSTASVYGAKSDEEIKRREFIIDNLILENKRLSIKLHKYDALSNTIKETKSIDDELINTNDEETHLMLKQKKEQLSTEYITILNQLNNFSTN